MHQCCFVTTAVCNERLSPSKVFNRLLNNYNSQEPPMKGNRPIADRRIRMMVRMALCVESMLSVVRKSWPVLCLVFTLRRYALHGLCDRNSVRLSVCLSVRHTRGLCPHGSTYDHDFFHRMVAPSLKFLGISRSSQNSKGVTPREGVE